MLSVALNGRQIIEKVHPTAEVCCTSRTLSSSWMSCRVRRMCAEDKLEDVLKLGSWIVRQTCQNLVCEDTYWAVA